MRYSRNSAEQSFLGFHYVYRVGRYLKTTAQPYLTRPYLNFANTLLLYLLCLFTPPPKPSRNTQPTFYDAVILVSFLIVVFFYIRINCDSCFKSTFTNMDYFITRGARIESKLQQLEESVNEDLFREIEEEAKELGYYCAAKAGIMTIPILRSDGHAYNFNDGANLLNSAYTGERLENLPYPMRTLQDQIETWLDQKILLLQNQFSQEVPRAYEIKIVR